MLVVDIETYKNYFLVVAFDPMRGLLRPFTINDAVDFNNYIQGQDIFTYNGIYFDVPILELWIKGVIKTDKQAYETAQAIISNDPEAVDTWELNRSFNKRVNNHVDLIKFLTERVSLKALMINIFSDKIQDLPYDPHMELTESQKTEVLRYCENDVLGTWDFIQQDKILDDIEIRSFIQQSIPPFSNNSGQSVWLKSSVQIAETAMVEEVKANNGGNLPSKRFKDHSVIKFSTCNHFPNPKFNLPQLQAFFEEVEQCTIETIKGDTLNVLTEKQASSLKKKRFYKLADGSYRSRFSININGKEFNYGLGGLHSKDPAGYYATTATKEIYNVDVASYYPSMMIEYDIGPMDGFTTVLSKWRDQRYEYKYSGQLNKSNTYKLFINGIFGKLNDNYSKLYCPTSAFSVTITGQIQLLKLIDMVVSEIEEIEVVNANTDGVCFYVNKTDIPKLKEIQKEWENITGMVLEADPFVKWIALGCNEYTALTPSGKVKTKGGRLLTKPSLTGKLNAPIVSEALYNLYVNGIEPIDYISEHASLQNILISSKSSTKKHIYDGQEVQGNVRYFYSKDGGDLLTGANVTVAKGVTLALDITDLKTAPVSSLNIDVDKYVEMVKKLEETIDSGVVDETKEPSHLEIINNSIKRQLLNQEDLYRIAEIFEQENLYPCKSQTSYYNLKKGAESYYKEGFVVGETIRWDEALFYQLRIPKGYFVVEHDTNPYCGYKVTYGDKVYEILTIDSDKFPNKKIKDAGYIAKKAGSFIPIFGVGCNADGSYFRSLDDLLNNTNLVIDDSELPF